MRRTDPLAPHHGCLGCLWGRSRSSAWCRRESRRRTIVATILHPPHSTRHTKPRRSYRHPAHQYSRFVRASCARCRGRSDCKLWIVPPRNIALWGHRPATRSASPHCNTLQCTPHSKMSRLCCGRLIQGCSQPDRSHIRQYLYNTLT